ncbi:MAG: hypothetical protein RJA99_3968 [Pseudomonadota bacterium]
MKIPLRVLVLAAFGARSAVALRDRSAARASGIVTGAR